MHRRPLVALIAGAALAIATGTLAGSAHAAQARQVHSGGVLVPSNPNQKLPVRGGTVDSLNWSGYAVTPGSGITAVSSTFVVPAASLIPPGFAATWTGIGGFNTQDLIQAGVEENSLPSNPLIGNQYVAWYELLPAAETPISGCPGDPNCTVAPGNTVSVSISHVSGSTWHIAMSNAGHWSWSLNVPYNSTESSAEWILEAPTLITQTLLANVGTVHFGPTSTYTSGGTTKTIAQGSPTQIDLSPGLINEATPSALASDGQSFNDCAYAQSCPTP
jgi:Peptidase A4 family